MHGGAITLARRYMKSGLQPDLLLATDMLDLTTFLALTRTTTARIPTVLYMHENQLTYPLPEKDDHRGANDGETERDHHYAFVNFTSMLVADAIWFNSSFHRTSFFNALPTYLKQFPEHRELGRIAELERKSLVLPVGVEMPESEPANAVNLRGTPLVLWNQRWEYDKNPELFLEVLLEAAGENLEFEVALCGESFQRKPAAFAAATSKLGDRIIHEGHADRRAYEKLLRQAEVVISTAYHEFFGISILEAISRDTFPILPDRLSYPELIPARFHPQCLYSSPRELRHRLKWALTERRSAQATASELARAVRRYAWEEVAPGYDRAIEELVNALQQA